MAKPSVSMSDELLDEFDDRIDELKLEQELDLDTNRSDVIRELMRQWLEGNSSSTASHSPQATAD